MKKSKPVDVEIKLPKPESLKQIGGEIEAWNDRIMRMVLTAMPIDHRDKVEAGQAATAVFSGMLDINAADPIEGMLIAQLVIAHEAALSMYRRAWAQPPEHFEARCRYPFSSPTRRSARWSCSRKSTSRFLFM